MVLCMTYISLYSQVSGDYGLDEDCHSTLSHQLLLPSAVHLWLAEESQTCHRLDLLHM